MAPKKTMKQAIKDLTIIRKGNVKRHEKLFFTVNQHYYIHERDTHHIKTLERYRG